MNQSTPTLPTSGFHHIAIRVVDFERSLQFYQDLGYRVARSWGAAPKRAVMLDLGNANLMEIFEGGSTEAPSEGRIIHFALRTPDCDAAHAAALAAGAEETMAPKDVTIDSATGPFPVRISFVKAPGGEIIEFFQNELT